VSAALHCSQPAADVSRETGRESSAARWLGAAVLAVPTACAWPDAGGFSAPLLGVDRSESIHEVLAGRPKPRLRGGEADWHASGSRTDEVLFGVISAQRRPIFSEAATGCRQNGTAGWRAKKPTRRIFRV
jgi:hypothetical protein